MVDSLKFLIKNFLILCMTLSVTSIAFATNFDVHNIIHEQHVTTCYLINVTCIY